MKAASFLLFLTFAAPVYAQELPTGYDAVIAAAEQVSSPPRKADGARTIEERREAVQRNASVLKQLRLALQQKIEAPIVAPHDEGALKRINRLQKLSQQLRFEMDVREADGDIVGALDSLLTAHELSAALTHGALLFGWVAAEITDSYFSSRDIAKVITKADAAALRTAVQRLKASDLRFATFAQMQAMEKLTYIKVVTRMSGEAKEHQAGMPTPEGPATWGMTEEQVKEVLELTPEAISAQLAESFDAMIARDHLPFSQAKRISLPLAKGVVNQLRKGAQNEMRDRLQYERTRTMQRLLAASLELRGIKQESGTYPLEFKAPLDPFGDGTPLLYKREGDSYILYSVGPDGIDDGGAEIQTLETNRATGAKTASGRLTPNSTGDILGPSF